MSERQPELNGWEVWVAEHSVRLTLVAAVLFIVGGVVAAHLLSGQQKAEKALRILEPQVRKVYKVKPICDTGALYKPKEAKRCAVRLRAVLLNCRRYKRCRAAFLLAGVAPPEAPDKDRKGVVHQKPHSAVQQPAPGQPGGEAPTQTPPVAPLTPGASGNAPEVGVKACVTLVVSACTKTPQGPPSVRLP